VFKETQPTSVKQAAQIKLLAGCIHASAHARRGTDKSIRRPGRPSSRPMLKLALGKD
jgi:hypothetical protein